MEYPNLKWHRMTAEDVISELHTNAACGLNRKAVRSRSRKYGKNTLFDHPAPHGTSLWNRLMTDASLWILLGACILSMCFSEEAIGICSLLCIAIGAFFFIRTLHSERQIEAQIDKYRIPWISVIRDGKRIQISARETVIGDILLLKAGDIVPCDCRLLSAQHLTVHTLMPDDDGNERWIELPKRADFVYGYGTEDVPPAFVNMLYGGSRIVQGTVIAIAVAIGKDTFLGAMKLFSVPAESKRNEKGNLSTLSPFLKLYGMLLLVLILPLTLIGIVLLPSGRTLIALFASLSAMLGVASPALLETYFHFASLRARRECFQQTPKVNRAVIKSARALDRLSSITDVFVLGTCGSSDGKPHLHRCALGNGEIRLDRNESYFSLQPTCEAFLLLSSAVSRELEKDFILPRIDDSELCRELIDASSFDVEAMRVRIKQVVLLSDVNAPQKLLEVQSKLGSYRIRFYEEAGKWNTCPAYESNGSICAMSPSMRERLDTFYHSARADGCRVITAIRDVDGRMVFLGALAIREQMQKTLPSVIEELKQSQVRTTFFLPQEDQRTKLYMRSLGLWEHTILKSESIQHQIPLSDCVLKYRVLVGFSGKEILALMLEMRKKGSRIAVMGNTVADFALMKHATLSIACDGMLYHTRFFESGSMEDDIQEDGLPESERCSQTMRRSADVLVARAQKMGGGVFALSQAIASSRAARVRVRSILLPLMIISQLLCVLFTLFSTVFAGVGAMNAFQILIGGFLFPLAMLSAVLTLPIPQNRLRKWISFDSGAVERLILDRQIWLPTAIAAFGSVLYCFILHLCNVMSFECSSSLITVSYVLLELILFTETILRMKMPIWHRGWLPIAIFVLSFLLLTVLSVCFPILSSVTGLGAWSILSVSSLPIPIALFFVSRFFIGFFSHRTSK